MQRRGHMQQLVEHFKVHLYLGSNREQRYDASKENLALIWGSLHLHPSPSALYGKIEPYTGASKWRYWKCWCMWPAALHGTETQAGPTPSSNSGPSKKRATDGSWGSIWRTTVLTSPSFRSLGLKQNWWRSYESEKCSISATWSECRAYPPTYMYWKDESTAGD